MADRSSDRPLLGRFGNQAMVYATGMVLSKLLSFLLLPLYTHYLTPADYGVVQLIDMTFEIVAIVAGTRLAGGVFHFYHKATTDAERVRVISTCSVMLTVSYAAVALTAIALRDPLSMLLFQSRDHGDAIRWAALSFVCQGMMIVPMAFLRVRGRATTFVVLTTVKFVLQALINYVLLVRVGLGLTSVFISNFASSLLMAGVIIWMTHREAGWGFSRPVARDLARFGLPLVMTQMATFFTTYGDRYFIQAYGTAADVGLYALAYQFGFLLVGVGYTPFQMVWDPMRFEIAKRPDHGAVFARAFVYVNVILVSTALAIALLVPDVLKLMSAPAFWPAAVIVPVILLGYVINCWSSVQDIGIMLSERTIYSTLATWAGALVALIGYWALIPSMRGMGAALATLLAFITRQAVAYVASQRLWPVKYRWGPVVKLMGMAVITFGASSSIHVANLWLSLAVRTALGAAYVAAVLMSGVLTKDDLALVREGAAQLRRNLRLSRGRGVTALPAAWTLSFAREWARYLSPLSIIRLRNYVVREQHGRLGKDALLSLDVRSPLRARVRLREVGSDAATFQEIVKDQVYRVVVESVGRCDTIVDLGGNIGLATLYFAAQYPGSRCMVVEPNPATYRLLETNLRPLVNAGRCRTLQAAVWDGPATLAGATTVRAERYSAFTVRAVEGEAVAPIQGFSMGQILEIAGFERIDLLKVDIEGAEVRLFSGEPEWLNRVGAIAIEFHGDSRAQSGFDELMRRFGFEVSDSDPHTVVAVRRGFGDARGATDLGGRVAADALPRRAPARGAVLVVSPWYLPSLGGIAVIAERLRRGLREAGLDAHLLITQEGEPRLREDSLAPGLWRMSLTSSVFGSLSVRTAFAMLLRAPACLWTLWRFARQQRIRTVLLLYPIENAWPFLMLRWLGVVRLMTSLQGDDMRRAPDHPPTFRWLLRQTLRASDEVVACAEHLAVDARDFCSRDDLRVRVIPNCADLRHFRPPPPGYVRRDPRPTVVHVSNFAAKKRVPDLVQAFARATLPDDARLVLVGSGHDFDVVRDLVSRLGIEARVTMAGGQVDVLPFLWESDLFVLSSEAEGAPLALVESMACGVPWVSTPWGAAAELPQGECGLAVPIAAIDLMADAISQLMRDPLRRRAMGERARARAATDYGERVYIERHLALF